MLDKKRDLARGLSEWCRLNHPGVARHGGLGPHGVRAPGNAGSGRCSLTHKCVSLWIVIFLPCELLVTVWLKFSVPVIIVLRYIYTCVCICKLVAQFLNKKKASLEPIGRVIMNLYGAALSHSSLVMPKYGKSREHV